MKFKAVNGISGLFSGLSDWFLKLLTVFIVSTSLLCLEFTMIRVMGFTHWFHFVYFSITMALLGFAISGTLLAVSKRLQDIPWDLLTNMSLLGFGVSTLIAINVSISIETDTLVLIEKLRDGIIGPALKVYLPILLVLTVPFFFCSLIICRTLMDFREKANVVYSVNLLGTATGAVIFLIFIGFIGAYSFVYAIVGVTFGLSYLIVRPSIRKGWVHLGYLAVMGILAIGVIWPSMYVFPKVDRSKGISSLYPDSIIETAWTPMFRVDLVQGEHSQLLLIDGDAWAVIPQITPDKLASADVAFNPLQIGLHIPFRMAPPELRKHALVIGAGGGKEVLAAYQAGFRHIDAVDIDPIRINWLKGKYANLLADLYHKPEVQTHIDDGRSFISRIQEAYDAIMIYNVDTLAAIATGSYNLVENYLYTVEAFRKYIGALSDIGILFVSRPGWGGSTETLKLFNTAVEALLSDQIDPRQHLLVIKHHQIDFILFKPTISDEIVAEIVKFYRTYDTKQIQTEILYYSGNTPNKDNQQFYDLLTASLNGNVSLLYEAALTDIRPVHDDRPFFFENQRWDRIVLHPFSYRPTSFFNNWSGFLLSVLAILSTIIVFLLVIYAYWGTMPRPSMKLGCMVSMYFVCIGIGYMFVQMTLIQRLSLVLGHPIISMAVIIPTLLISMGLVGFWIRPEVAQNKRLSLGLLILPALILLGYETVVFEQLIKMANQVLIVRVPLVIVTLIPLGLALGICFPLGLLHFRRISAAMTPIAWTANGGASVIGSILAMLISLIFGFHVTMTMAWIFYLVGIFPVAIIQRETIS